MRFLPAQVAGAALLAALPACAGDIVGTVRGEGPVVPEGAAGGGGNYSSQRYKFAEKIDYANLTGFVVYIDEAIPDPAGEKPAKRKIVQRDAEFEPKLTVVEAGTNIEWPNADDIFHNVFSMSDASQFNLGLYTMHETPPVVLFDKPGRVDVYCSIHSRMHCIVYVVPSRFYQVVDSGKSYALKNVPAGTYRLKAWHEVLPVAGRTVTVPEQGDVRADFTLSVAVLPKR